MTLFLGAFTIGLILSLLALGIYISYRVFDVAEFSGELALLRLTSAKTGNDPYVDLMFRGVSYFDLPARLSPGLEVAQPQAHDLAFVNSRLDARVAPETVFVLIAGTRRFRVVAAELKVAEEE